MQFMEQSSEVLRPLLKAHRFEVRQFIQFWRLPIYSDQSNQKTYFLRNKIRKQLIPLLRIHFNPKIDSVLLNFTDIKTCEQQYFQNVYSFLLISLTNLPKYSFLPVLNFKFPFYAQIYLISPRYVSLSSYKDLDLFVPLTPYGGIRTSISLPLCYTFCACAAYLPTIYYYKKLYLYTTGGTQPCYVISAKQSLILQKKGIYNFFISYFVYVWCLHNFIILSQLCCVSPQEQNNELANQNIYHLHMLNESIFWLQLHFLLVHNQQDVQQFYKSVLFFKTPDLHSKASLVYNFLQIEDLYVRGKFPPYTKGLYVVQWIFDPKQYPFLCYPYEVHNGFLDQRSIPIQRIDITPSWLHQRSSPRYTYAKPSLAKHNEVILSQLCCVSPHKPFALQRKSIPLTASCLQNFVLLYLRWVEKSEASRIISLCKHNTYTSKMPYHLQIGLVKKNHCLNCNEQTSILSVKKQYFISSINSIHRNIIFHTILCCTDTNNNIIQSVKNYPKVFQKYFLKQFFQKYKQVEFFFISNSFNFTTFESVKSKKEFFNKRLPLFVNPNEMLVVSPDSIASTLYGTSGVVYKRTSITKSRANTIIDQKILQNIQSKIEKENFLCTHFLAIYFINKSFSSKGKILYPPLFVFPQKIGTDNTKHLFVKMRFYVGRYTFLLCKLWKGALYINEPGSKKATSAQRSNVQEHEIIRKLQKQSRVKRVKILFYTTSNDFFYQVKRKTYSERKIIQQLIGIFIKTKFSTKEKQTLLNILMKLTC